MALRLVIIGGGPNGATSRLARAVMAGFKPLFRFARLDSRWGWQLVAVARVPSKGTAHGAPGG